MNKIPNQKKYWDKEYGISGFYRSSGDIKPSKKLMWLKEFLDFQKVNYQDWYVLDLACGNGRNSIYLIENLKVKSVYAIDFSKVALKQFNNVVEEKNLNQINMIDHDLGKKFPLPDDYFDLSLDLYGSINLSSKQRDVFRNEVYRVLKTDGLHLAYLTSTESSFFYDTEIIDSQPENYGFIFKSRKFEKAYTENEIYDSYKDFNILDIRKYSKPPLELFWVLMKKH